ncbi:Mu transposase domain-containing protein [Weissella cibaria]|uniref:Mu transposase domain-containing protein n=1 Tax=Weissella cibaria TaxID=137591 RepID=UPI0013FA9417|nr:hypothetical protein [Weissella cibaria]
MIQEHIDNRHYRKVSIESMINYQGKKYSVSTKYIGKRVETINSDTKLYSYYNCEIIRYTLRSNASDDEIMMFRREHTFDYDFIMTHEEGDGLRTDD